MDGNFIRQKIEESDLQLNEVAIRLGISPQNLQNKLKSQDIKVSFLREIAEAINKSVYFFFEETKSEKNLIIPNDKKNDKVFDSKRNVKNTLSNEDFSDLGVPLIPIDAMAGFGTGAVQVMDYEAETYVVPEFTELKVDFMIRVKGSSMYPKYNSGDLVACKKLVLSKLFFQWNKVYVLDTEQGAIIKRILPSKKPKSICLISENPTYPSFDLEMSEIYAIALVVGVIRFE